MSQNAAHQVRIARPYSLATFNSEHLRWMRTLVFSLLTLWMTLAAPHVWAAAGTYRLFIDSDANAATGCTADLVDRFGPGTATGFEYQVTVAVDAAGNASGATLASCAANSFTGATPVGQTAPTVALVPDGANLLAQLELLIPISTMGITSRSRVVVATDGDFINYLSPDSTSNITLAGAPRGPAPASATPIPATSAHALALLALLLAVLGVLMVCTLARKEAAPLLLALLLIAISGTALAALALMIDGNTDDWAGISPLATDITGDQVSGTADLHQLTVVLQDDQMFLRIDAVEAANPQRTLSVLETESILPRFLTHPSLVASVGQVWHYAPQATDQQGQSLSLTLTQSPAGMQITGALSNPQLVWTPTAAGIYWVRLQTQDNAGHTQTQVFPLYVSDDRQLPADPITQATALSSTGFTPFAEHTAFLYQAADPIQTGVQDGAIDPVTATVVRGQVLDDAGQPLPGATVRIAGHPEYGQTRTRADGWYDLAANGGGWITVHIEKLGYMSAQRRFQAPWRDWAIAPEVVLLPYDSQYTSITAGATQPQLYWGSILSDGRGDRRTSIYFPANTQATAVLPDGSTQPLTQMNVRVSEYTVGSRGPQSMPADLNLAVGYTWAANFTVDEAANQWSAMSIISSTCPSARPFLWVGTTLPRPPGSAKTTVALSRCWALMRRVRPSYKSPLKPVRPRRQNGRRWVLRMRN